MSDDLRKVIINALEDTPNIIKERKEVISKRANAIYDGVMGTPDKWVTEDILHKFESIRNNRLDDINQRFEGTSIPKDSLEEFSHRQLVDLVNERINPPTLENEDCLRNAFYDAGDVSRDELIKSDIDFLARLLAGVKKGYPEGLKIILGEDTGKYAIAGKKQEATLLTGTSAAKKINIERRRSHEEACIKWAKEELDNNPKLPLKKLIPIVHGKSGDAGYKFNGKPYSEGTIRNILTSLKKSQKPK